MPESPAPPDGVDPPPRRRITSGFATLLAAGVGSVFGLLLSVLLVQLLEVAAGAGSTESRLGLLAAGFVVGVAIGRAGGYRRFSSRIIAAIGGFVAAVGAGYAVYLLDYYPVWSEFLKAVSNTTWTLFERWFARAFARIDGLIFVASSWLASYLAGRLPFRVRRRHVQDVRGD